MRGDAAAIRMVGRVSTSGSAAVAKAFQGRAQEAHFVLVDGMAGVVVAPRGRPQLVLGVTTYNRKDRAAIRPSPIPERLTKFKFALPPEKLVRGDLEEADRVYIHSHAHGGPGLSPARATP